MLASVRRWFAVPDFLLFGWVGIAQPVLFAASAAPGDDLLGRPGNALLGALYVVAGIGALVTLVTRDADAPTDPIARPSAEHELSLAGPTSTGVLLVFLAGFGLLGAGPPEWLIGVVFVAAFAGAIARSRMPPLAGATRRLLVTPFVMAAAGIFDQAIATAADLLDIRLLGAIRSTEDLILALNLAGIGLVVAGFFYVMLIVAPRRLAGDRSGRWPWVARFALFVVSVLLGVAVAALVERA